MAVLLVSSGGGHLKQLTQLADRLPFGDGERVWATYDTGLSRALQAREDVQFLHFAESRDVTATVKNFALARDLLAKRRFEQVVSTGASPALSFLPLARAKGAHCYYIESAARAAGPSVTGRIMARTPGIRTFTQYRHWADAQWPYAGSVFDSYATGPQRDPVVIKRAVVSVGTSEAYSFRRLFDRLVPLLDGVDVLWQTGATNCEGLGIEARATVPHDELLAAIDEADVVINHSGTGAALSTFERGKMPLLVPRLHRFAEHVDDHQLQIAGELAARGLAVHRAVEDLDENALQLAARGSITPVLHPPVLDLGDLQ